MSQPTWDSIIIAGERFTLGSGVKVITHEDPGGWSFEKERPAAIARMGSSLYGKRYLEGKPVKSLEQLEGVVTQVVLHTDLTRDSKLCFDVLVDRGLSTHFMIDWDGTVYQGLDPLYEAFHAGEANAASVGIDLNNRMRNLEREPSEPPYPREHARKGEMTQKEFKRPKSPKMVINGGSVRSYGYTDPQYTALLALLKVLVKVMPGIKPFVPLDETGEIVPNVLEDGAGFSGVLGHWHLSPSRWDPGPGLDWQRVHHGLAREHNAFPLELLDGQNIATLLEPKRVEAYAERYYSNNEESELGGWYPVGRNQQWHGGLHLNTRKAGQEVFAMFDGVLVAGRMGRRPSERGSNNFLCLRHDLEIPTRKKGETKKLTIFSLYMHLQYVDVEERGAHSPDWVRALHRIDEGAAEEAAAAMEGGLAEDEEEDRAGPRPGAEEDEEEGLFASDDELDPEDTPIEDKPYLEVGRHISAFKRGEVALVEWQDSPVRISSGEPIGKVGQFGPPDDWEPTLHVEIFAPKGWDTAIDLGVHGRHFVEIEGDLDGDLFVETRQLLDLFDPSSWMAKKGTLVAKRVVDPAEIESFYNNTYEGQGAKAWLRKAITRHVSEWSDQVDWVQALSAAEDWNDRIKDIKGVLEQSGIFRGALRQVLPFIWLNREVAEHIGLDTTPWDGVVYHFHPIHFLLWLTYHSSQRIQVISKGLSLAAIKKRIKKEERLRKAGKLQESDACIAAAIELEDVDSSSAREVLEDWWELEDQGQWRIEREEEDI